MFRIEIQSNFHGASRAISSQLEILEVSNPASDDASGLMFPPAIYLFMRSVYMCKNGKWAQVYAGCTFFLDLGFEASAGSIGSM